MSCRSCFIIPVEVRARGKYVKGCRCGEKLRAVWWETKIKASHTLGGSWWQSVIVTAQDTAHALLRILDNGRWHANCSLTMLFSSLCFAATHRARKRSQHLSKIYPLDQERGIAKHKCNRYAHDHKKHKPNWDGFLYSRERLSAGETLEKENITLEHEACALKFQVEQTCPQRGLEKQSKPTRFFFCYLFCSLLN